MKPIDEIEYLDEEERELIEDIESAPVQPPIPNMAGEIARYRRMAAEQLYGSAALPPNIQPSTDHSTSNLEPTQDPD